MLVGHHNCCNKTTSWVRLFHDN